jgi:HSP20 family protein
MWFDNQLDQMFRSLSDRFFNMDDDFELAKYAFTQPYSCGYSMIMGNNGRPLIRQYGTPVPGLITSDVREPFVDEVVDKSGNTLKLVAEMPGVDKKDIKVTIEGKYAKISAEHGKRKYQTQIPLKYKVDENSTKATYANGILEVSFRLIEQKPKGKAITID